MKKIAGLLILVAFALVGCCSTPEVQVASEKLCTGTKRPYQVQGTWYSPQEHYSYEEEGIASWYGPRFHGKPKSCGEIFNMHGISAAHKTLPIPSVVRVTNVKNGSTVKLLVDDRGPFVGDRIIDLSKGAATYLGICNSGLGKVRVECLPEESKAFAKFVAKYGRYGRDPEGRSWETIFRQNFDYDDSTPLPKPLKTVHRERRLQNLPKSAAVHRYPPARRPNVKPIPVSRSIESEEEINEREIKQLLEDTRAYLGRKQA